MYNWMCVNSVLGFIAHHEGPPKHTDLCVFLLNWLSLKGSAPQLNVTTGYSLLSVPCWAWAVLPSANSSMRFGKKFPPDECTVSQSFQSLVQHSCKIWKTCSEKHLLPHMTHYVMNTEWCTCACLYMNICMFTLIPCRLYLQQDKPQSTLLLKQ